MFAYISFIDKTEIQVSQNTFHNQIFNPILDCRLGILFVSNNFWLKKWCLIEAYLTLWNLARTNKSEIEEHITLLTDNDFISRCTVGNKKVDPDFKILPLLWSDRICDQAQIAQFNDPHHSIQYLASKIRQFQGVMYTFRDSKISLAELAVKVLTDLRLN